MALVPGDRVEDVWPWVLPLLDKAIARGLGEYGPPDVAQNLSDGVWQLWIVTEPGRLVAFAVTSISYYPRKRHLFITYAGGRLRYVQELWPFIRQYAVEKQCDLVRFSGRPGWVRSGVLPKGSRYVFDDVAVPLGES